MKFAVPFTITVVSSFGSILASSASGDLSVSLVDKIRRADALLLVQAQKAEQPSRRRERSHSSDDRLEIKATDLLRSVIRIVQSYTDDDFQDLLKVVHDKIEKIDNSDKKVVELKRAVLKKLKDMGGGVGGVKGDLGDVLTRLQESKYEGRAIKLDSADKRASALNLLTTLNDLDAYRFKSKRTDISLSDVVRGGLEAIAALLAAQAPPTRGTSTSSSPAPTEAPTEAPAQAPATRADPALGELVLLSLLSLPSLSNVRLQLVKETQVDEPH